MYACVFVNRHLPTHKPKPIRVVRCASAAQSITDERREPSMFPAGYRNETKKNKKTLSNPPPRPPRPPLRVFRININHSNHSPMFFP